MGDSMIRTPRRALAGLASVALVASGALSALVVGASSAAVPLWHSDAKPSPAGSWFAVAYNNKTWVAAGRTGDIAFSPDAVHWTMVPVTAGSWQSLAYGKGIWVTLSSTNSVPGEMTSVSGKLWTAHTSAPGRWSSVVFGNGMFVAVGFEGEVMTSKDGLHWTKRHSGDSSNSWYAVAFGNGRFVAVDGNNGDTMVSTNGVNWSIHHPSIEGYGWGAVAFGNGTFVAFDDSISSSMGTSVDGAVWTYHHYSQPGNNYSGTFGCHQFLSVSSFGAGVAHYQSSAVGTSWTTTPTVLDPTGVNWTAVGYGNGKFVAVNDGGNITWSAAPRSCKQAIADPVTHVRGSLGGGSLLVSWNPPAYGGIKKVASYVVKITSGNSVHRCYSATTTCRFSGLIARRTYVLSVSAVNAAHLFSVPSDPVTLFSSASSSFTVTSAQPVALAHTAATMWVSGAPSSWLVRGAVGAATASCVTNSFGQCQLRITDSTVGVASVHATYRLAHVTHNAALAHYASVLVTGINASYVNGATISATFSSGVANANASLVINAVTTTTKLNGAGNGTVIAAAPLSGTSASIAVFDDGVYLETVVVALTV